MKIPVKLMNIFVWMSFISVSHAEIVLDGTLGSSGSLPGPDYLISDNLGKQSGTNLFHSFESFNIEIDKSATFTSSIPIKNVISRVTGTNPSRIDGTLRSEIPNANLYLLNPNGILFGEKASLDISGSFHASTADYLRLKNGQMFYVNQSNDFSLMVAPPSRFGFLNSTPANITIQDSTLKIEGGKDLSFISGDLSIENSNLSTIDGGQINLISVASKGEVVPGLPNTDQKMGTIKILGNSMIAGDTEFDTDYKGGDIFIEANQMTMAFNGSCQKNICPGISSDTHSNGNGGRIDINIAEELKITGNIGISTASNEPATGHAGYINLKVGQLNLNDGGFINSGTSSSGNGGNINITASKGISLFGDSRISSTLNSGSSATRGGDIYIKTPRLEIKGSLSAIQTGASFPTIGDAGNIKIHADDIRLEEGATVISSSIGSGKSGDISIFGNRIELKRSSLMSFGNMDGGDINIKIRDHLYLHDSGILTSGIENISVYSLYKNGLISLEQLQLILKSTGELKLNNGGNINISKPQLFVLEKSQILATATSGKGGNINIDADNFIHSFPYEEGGELRFELPYLLNLIFDFDDVNFNASRINASSAFGFNGEISINALERDITTDLLPLPEKHQMPNLPLNRCAGLSLETISKFIITIRDISPPTPEDLKTHYYIP
jgi:filamentous hemagglutinin family protein